MSGLGNAIPGTTPRAQIDVRTLIPGWPLRARAAQPVTVKTRVKNLSARPFRAQASYGRRLVRLGAQLMTEDGTMINRDHARAWLPATSRRAVRRTSRSTCPPRTGRAATRSSSTWSARASTGSRNAARRRPREPWCTGDSREKLRASRHPEPAGRRRVRGDLCVLRFRRAVPGTVHRRLDLPGDAVPAAPVQQRALAVAQRTHHRRSTAFAVDGLLALGVAGIRDAAAALAGHAVIAGVLLAACRDRGPDEVRLVAGTVLVLSFLTYTLQGAVFAGAALFPLVAALSTLAFACLAQCAENRDRRSIARWVSLAGLMCVLAMLCLTNGLLVPFILMSLAVLLRLPLRIPLAFSRAGAGRCDRAIRARRSPGQRLRRFASRRRPLRTGDARRAVRVGEPDDRSLDRCCYQCARHRCGVAIRPGAHAHARRLPGGRHPRVRVRKLRHGRAGTLRSSASA